MEIDIAATRSLLVTTGWECRGRARSSLVRPHALRLQSARPRNGDGPQPRRADSLCKSPGSDCSIRPTCPALLGHSAAPARGTPAAVRSSSRQGVVRCSPPTRPGHSSRSVMVSAPIPTFTPGQRLRSAILHVGDQHVVTRPHLLTIKADLCSLLLSLSRSAAPCPPYTASILRLITCV